MPQENSPANDHQTRPTRQSDAMLPEHLAERTVERNHRPLDPSGDFVLCWLHHAIRADENPALDVALTIGNAHDKPVLVYQGLAGNHRFNSDRHHRFILEGARDLSQQLHDRGIAFAFHLPADPSAPSPLRGLARRAVAIVTEDFPAPPFPRWTDRIAERAACRCLAVDAACLMPIRSIRTRHTRAFKFRTVATPAWDERIQRTWNAISPAAPMFNATAANLSFEPLDLATADLNVAISRCDIDHSIPPVTHITGGSTAAHARWQTFVTHHIRKYDRRRNDATEMDAVSGLSPYLHHGHLSPFRVAREADAIGGSGPAKFLDELLVWRELSYNFCANTPSQQLESLDALPEWARATLNQCANDERDANYDWERLSRGVTHDQLWNAAQHSLLLNGEMHNNIRMTWGKTIPRWIATPSEALRLLIDLNHRFALDGNNPNSYGGLLWCLGQFDRPFDPPNPITGTIRPRSTDTHAERLDPARYARAVRARHRAAPPRIAVIGAGIAGLSAARTLVDHRCDVSVFDRGRIAGGRIATRHPRPDTDRSAVDHGAPAFSVTDPRFGRHLRAWITQGYCARWTHTEHQNGTTKQAHAFVGQPTMDALCSHLGNGIPTHHDTTVTAVTRDDSGAYRLAIDTGSDNAQTDTGPFDAVILAAAPPQSQRLLADLDPSLHDQVGRITTAPAWVLMLELEHPADGAPEVIRLEHPVLQTLIRIDTKPGREHRPGQSVWAAHATADWAASRLDAPRDHIQTALLDATIEALAPHLGTVADQHVLHARVHRWSFARTDATIDARCIASNDGTLIICGDGFAGNTVESAFLSGQAAAGRTLSARPTLAPATTAATLFS